MRRAIVLPLLLAGCATLRPSYERPPAEVSVPLSWPAGDVYLANSEGSLDSLTYTQVFRDPRLQSLIAQALSGNRDLATAVANIRAARAQYRVQRSDRLPNVNAGVGATFGYAPGRAGTGTFAGGTTPGAGTGSGVGVGTGSDSYATYTANAGFSAFDLDLFGRVASLSEAALNEYFATEAAARSVRLSLVGELATAWATIAADRELLAIAQDTVESAGRSVRLTRLRLEGGVAPRTDLRQAETVLETANSDLAAARTAVARDRNAIELLIGQPVAEANLPDSLAMIDTAFGPVPAGLSSTILLRRPDVVQAEYRLIAGNARIGAARAALFPRLSLTGLLGLASTALTGLFDTDAFNASIGPNLSVPIFDGGARRAGVTLSQAQRDALLSTYEGTLQTAFREVADALARRGTIGDQIAADERLRAAALDTYDLATARYRGGIDPFLPTLDAQRSLYSARRRLVSSRLTGAANLVTLYVALGGDPALNALPLGEGGGSSPEPRRARSK